MLGQPAGWYQDPAPANPASPETVRFWDGQGWTSQVRLASKKERQEWRLRIEAENRAYVRDLVRRAEAGDVEAQQILHGPPQGKGTRNTTPDGQLLSGWWRRVFADIVDSTVVFFLGALLAWPWLKQVVAIMREYVDRAVSAAQAGVEPPATTAMMGDLVNPLLMVGLVFVVVGIAYEVGFLKAFNATPGKMLIGIEVRLRDRPGDLPWSTLFVRWFAKRGYALLGIIPFVGIITGLYYYVDNLWPLWDAKRQALHDKMASTNVVRR
jgi:uncharacterized RDD family membrane protein YckC